MPDSSGFAHHSCKAAPTHRFQRSSDMPNLLRRTTDLESAETLAGAAIATSSRDALPAVSPAEARVESQDTVCSGRSAQGPIVPKGVRVPSPLTLYIETLPEPEFAT